jgi:hypothetical protein
LNGTRPNGYVGCGALGKQARPENIQKKKSRQKVRIQTDTPVIVEMVARWCKLQNVRPSIH